MKEKLLLIGGSNIDYIGTSRDKLIDNVSNIGMVKATFGGVMRNVCENLALLGNKIDFITAIGKDMMGNAMKQELVDLGVDLYCPETDFPSGTYLAINDSNHDMVNAICDNRIITTLNPNFIKSLDQLIRKHEYIILDSNPNEELISYLFQTYKDKKFIVESISPTKVMKYKDYLNQVYLIKCNIYEARALVDKEVDAKDATELLLQKGITNVVVSNSSKDIYFGNKEKVDSVPVNKIENIVNTTGCGDALFSGIIDRLLEGDSLKEAVEFGHQLSNVVIMSEGATSKDIVKYKRK